MNPAFAAWCVQMIGRPPESDRDWDELVGATVRELKKHMKQQGLPEVDALPVFAAINELSDSEVLGFVRAAGRWQPKSRRKATGPLQ